MGEARRPPNDPLPAGTVEVRTRPLAAAVGICVGMMLLGSLLGALVGRDLEVEWYQELARPQAQAPAALFLLVSILYYPLFALLLYRGLTRVPPGRARTGILTLAVGALLLNTLWNPVMVGLRDPFMGVAGTGVLLLLVAGLLGLLLRRDRVAALLLAPYLLWVGWDLVWNWQLWQLNPAGG